MLEMTDRERWLATAGAIARHLVKTSHRYEDRCTWMGTTQTADDETDELEFTYATLGPELYGGTSGVALFLAEASARLDDRSLAASAEAGIRHALERAAKMPRASRLGFYSGAVGIAYAAVRIGRLLERSEHVDAALRLVEDLPVDEPDAPFDIIDGAAGAAPALLRLASWCPGADLDRIALRLGERLLDGATRHSAGDGWSWRDPVLEADDAPHLTGFSHGAAGIGWCLLAMHRATGEARWLAGAERAFSYENRWYRSAEENWPDFRGASAPDDPAPYGAAWCHGAPGIGLSRVRALVPGGVDAFRDDAKAALRSSVRALAALDADPDGDGSLCHGRAGVAEIIVELSAVLEDDGARQLALASVDAAAARFSAAPGLWPCGVARGTNPSLMLGLAGIGYAYLRLADPSLGSVLEPGS